MASNDPRMSLLTCVRARYNHVFCSYPADGGSSAIMCQIDSVSTTGGNSPTSPDSANAGNADVPPPPPPPPPPKRHGHGRGESCVPGCYKGQPHWCESGGGKSDGDNQVNNQGCAYRPSALKDMMESQLQTNRESNNEVSLPPFGYAYDASSKLK